MVVWKGLMALVAALVVKGEVMEYRRSVCLHRRSELRLHCKHTNPHGFIHVQKVVLGFSNDTHDCTNPDTLTYNASCHVIGTTWPKYLTCELQEECDLHMLGLSLDRCGNRGAYSNFAIVEYKCLQGPTDRISCVYGSACSGNGSWDLANDVTVDGGQQGSGWTGGGGPGLDSGSVPTHWSPPGVEYYDQDWFLSTYDFGENWEDSDWNSANYNYDATMYYYWSDWWQDYASRYDYSNYETPGDWGQYYSDMDWSSYSDWTPWGEDYPDWSPWRNGGKKDGRPERRKRQALESTLLQKIIPGGHFSTLQYGDLSNRNGMDTSMIRSRIKREYVPSEAFPAISMYLADWPLLGYIVSPNFPHKYPDNLDGLCHLQTVRGAEIHLQFDRFHIESDDACIWDYLTLRTEHYAVHLCDKLMPGTKRSLGTAWAQLHFHTDESVEKSGFLIAYWATHPNGEHAKIGVWCGPLNVTERFLSTFNPEEEVRNHQIQLSAPSSHVDGGSSTGISVTLIGAAIGGILVLIVLVTVVTICLCTRKRNTPAKPMQPAPVIPKVHFEPPPDYSSLSVPPDGRLSTINQYEALNIPPVPPRCAPSAYERPSHTLYHAAPIREQIYDEVNQYQPGSQASYIYPSSNDGRPTGLVAFNNRAYENETFPQNGLCTSDRICDRSPDNNVYSSVHEDYYINMNSPSAM